MEERETRDGIPVAREREREREFPLFSYISKCS